MACHFFAILCVICVFVTFRSEACNTHVSNPIGHVTPSEDFMLEVGSPLVVYCNLILENAKKYNPSISSKDIYFKFIPDFGDRVKIIPKKYYQYLNATTAQLYIKNTTMDHNGKYSCYVSLLHEIGPPAKYRSMLVCATAVIVGYPPQGIGEDDIHCESANWHNMTCTWEAQNNTIPTTYKFYYSYFESRSGEIECKLQKNVINRCFMTVDVSHTNNTNFYRQVSKYYYFTIRGENIFGKSENKFQLNHYNFVRPNAPSFFDLQRVHQRSMKLEWLPPSGMEGFPDGLKYELSFQSQYDDDWISVLTEDNTLMINNLLPNTIYQLRLRCTSASATGNDLKWSGYYVRQQITDPDVPRTPPNVTAGMFEEIRNNHSSRAIIVYWKHVLPQLRNGENFQYRVSYVERGNVRKRSTDIDDNTETTEDFYVRFNNLSPAQSYDFYVRVGNKEGYLPNVYSTIRVLNEEKMLGKPINFQVKMEKNDTYQLSWEPPTSDANKLKSYTVFWCKQRTRYYNIRCRTPLDWLVVPADQQEVTLYISDEKDTYYQFSVSSNSESSSSGMVWTPCINGVVDTVSVVSVAPTGASSLKVSWSSACFEEKKLIIGFNVQFCKSEHSKICFGPYEEKIVKGDSIILDGLDNYQLYVIRVAYIQENGIKSEYSDPVTGHTLEGVPGVLQAPIILGTDNSSIIISWKKAEKPNGRIIKYKVMYNDFTVIVNESGIPEYLLSLNESIIPYQNYELAVAACTSVGCSKSENIAFAKTAVGDNSNVDYKPMESDNETIDSYESDDVDLSEHEDDGVMLSDSWKRISDIFSDCRPNSLPELVRNFSGVNPALNCNANNSVLDCFKKFITNDVIVLVVLSCDRIARLAGATPLPGIMEPPRYDIINETYVLVFWKKPLLSNGELDAVELMVEGYTETEDGEYRQKVDIYRFREWKSKTYIVIECPIFNDNIEMQMYNLTVRAGNVVGNDTLYGPWSKISRVNKCFPPVVEKWIAAIVGSVMSAVILVVCIIFCYCSRRRKSDSNATKSIILPLGLDSKSMMNAYKDFSSGLKSSESTNGSIIETCGVYMPLVGKSTLRDINAVNKHLEESNSYSNSTQEFLRMHQRIMSQSGSIADLMSEQNGFLSNWVVKTHLSNQSNDSGLHCDIDTSQPSPDAVFEGLPNFRTKGSSPFGSLQFKVPSLPIVNESQNQDADDHSRNTECSDDSGTADLPNSKIYNSTNADLVHRDDFLNPPYCKLGFSHMRGPYIPVHRDQALSLRRKIAGSEPNIAEPNSPVDPDSGNSSVVHSVFPPYTQLGLASSHIDISKTVPAPVSYSEVCKNMSSVNPYVSMNSFTMQNENKTPNFFPASPYSKFGLLNIPTKENIERNPSNPYVRIEPVRKWDIPKNCKGGIIPVQYSSVTFDNPVPKPVESCKSPTAVEGYSVVSAVPEIPVPVSLDIDSLPEPTPILCVPSIPGKSTGAIPKTVSKPVKNIPQKKLHSSETNGYIPHNPLASTTSCSQQNLPASTSDCSPSDWGTETLLLNHNDTSATNDSYTPLSFELGALNNTATSTPRTSPVQLPKVTAKPNFSGSNHPTSMTSGYVPNTLFITPSSKDSIQPLSCANLPIL
ncbi:Cytokine receptor [Nymphon striatum]|nr:Cytokine receptor [Nymphon striatum]